MSADSALYSRTSFITLPRGETTLSVAEQARATALSFVNGISTGWGKHELHGWLMGPYASITGYAPPIAGDSSSRSTFRDTRKNVPALDDATLGTLLRDARWGVLAGIEASTCPRSRGSYVGNALAHHLAVPCIDAEGWVGWVPVDVLSARLHQRVLALFAIDQLRNPELHKSALFVCPRCECVLFDAEARRRGYCDMHGSRSEEATPANAHAANATTDNRLVRPSRATQRYVIETAEATVAPQAANAAHATKRTLIGVGRPI